MSNFLKITYYMYTQLICTRDTVVMCGLKRREGAGVFIKSTDICADWPPML